MLRRMYENVVKEDSDTKTWVVHPKRDRLHQIEIDLGFYEITNDMNKDQHRFEDGDRFLVHSGLFQIKSLWKSMRLLGVGDDVTLCSSLCDANEEDRFMFLENVEIVGSHGWDTIPTLTMTNCNIPVMMNYMMVGRTY